MILCFVQLYISIFTPHLRENRAETAIENGVGGGSVVVLGVFSNAATFKTDVFVVAQDF